MIQIHPSIINYDEHYANIFAENTALHGKHIHIKNIQKITKKLLILLNTDEINNELLYLCAKHHDDGRLLQYSMFGKFLDNKISHNVLGLELFDNFLSHGNYTTLNESVEIFRNCILYHGRIDLCTSDISKPYVKLVTIADDLENAISCVSYLAKEVENDEKGYREAHPNADQTFVSDFVFKHFATGNLFNKAKHCHTYAEYVLFAATLMTSYIKKYPFVKNFLLESGYGYSSILDGYKDVFYKTLSPEMAEKCYKILSNYAIMN